MGAWNVRTMSGAYGVAAAGPYPVRHPFWVTMSRARKIGILTADIRRLKGMKQTNHRKSRILQLSKLLEKIQARDASPDTSDVDAEIAALEADLAATPEIAPMPMVPEARPAGAPILPILATVAVLGGAAYFFTRGRK
jgi:hypothetical protein